MFARLLVAAAVAALPWGAAAEAEAEPRLISFVMLKDGASLADRRDYEAALAPIAAKHGASIAHSYDLAAHLGGRMAEAVRVRVWDLGAPGTMQAILEDPDYAALVPMRDAVHRTDALPLYRATPILEGAQIGTGSVLIDLVVMKPGFGAAERDAYEAEVRAIAEPLGFELVAAYRIEETLGGVGPQNPLRLNIWRLDDPAAMQALGQDPRYQALEAERTRLHDFAELTLFLATPDG